MRYSAGLRKRTTRPSQQICTSTDTVSQNARPRGSRGRRQWFSKDWSTAGKVGLHISCTEQCSTLKFSPKAM
ncbi:hypothetical protein B0H12DRAFT_1148145 [Mycena haematopus]|nr:hypothetical protein B0H12DRAFT_1148145 [Mycena haematopus]